MSIEYRGFSIRYVANINVHAFYARDLVESIFAGHSIYGLIKLIYHARERGFPY